MNSFEEIDMQNQRGIEEEPVHGSVEVSPNKISFAEADLTLDKLLQKFTHDENFHDVIDARRGIASNEVEKGKRGNIRGALVPLAATAGGIGAGILFNNEAYKLARAGSELTGWASPLFNSLKVLEKFSPYMIGTVASGLSSLVGSGIRRAFGENIYDYYSRYSHLDADGNILTKPLKIAYNWYTRGLEHLAFNTFITNPSDPEQKVKELIELGKSPDLKHEDGSEISRDDKENLVAKGYLHLVSTDVTEYFGAEFNDEEKQRIMQYRQEVTSAIDRFKKDIPEEERAEFDKKIYDKVVNEEKIKYLITTGLTSSISALKAFAFGAVFDVVLNFIFPGIPGLNRPELQDAKAEVKVEVPNPSSVRSEVQAGVPDFNTAPQGLPNMGPAVAPPLGEFKDYGLGEVPMPVPVQIAEALEPSAVEAVKSAEVTLPKVDVQGALNRASQVANDTMTKGAEFLRNITPEATTGNVPVSTSEVLEPSVVEAVKSVEVTFPKIDIQGVVDRASQVANDAMIRGNEFLRNITPEPTLENIPATVNIVTDSKTTESAGVIAAEAAKIIEPSIIQLPKLEVTGFAPALESLPTISSNGVIEAAGTVGSLMTIDEGLVVLNELAIQNPQALEQAVEQLHNSPDLGKDIQDVIGSLGSNAPQIMEGIRNLGPAAPYILNKILQVVTCGMSLPTGGMACPVLAGP
ncbi:hypothetical protein KBD45_04240 [Candidatus Dojkabacteria bacterium]|nr:hypothetical protein [Candidatus Dojkabacteria bacterium]